VGVKGVLCGVRGVDIASSISRVVEVRCTVDPTPTYMRTRRRAEGIKAYVENETRLQTYNTHHMQLMRKAVMKYIGV
jgi:hypothetical protein